MSVPAKYAFPVFGDALKSINPSLAELHSTLNPVASGLPKEDADTISCLAGLKTTKEPALKKLLAKYTVDNNLDAAKVEEYAVALAKANESLEDICKKINGLNRGVFARPAIDEYGTRYFEVVAFDDVDGYMEKKIISNFLNGEKYPGVCCEHINIDGDKFLNQRESTPLEIAENAKRMAELS